MIPIMVSPLSDASDIPSPPGVLTDEQAASIEQAGGVSAAPFELRPALTAHLNQYHAFRASAPTAAMGAASAAGRSRLEALSLDFDKETAGLSMPSLTFATDDAGRAAGKQALLADAFMLHRAGSVPLGVERERLRDSVATDFFGEGQGIGSDEKFALAAQSWGTRQKDFRKLLVGVEGKDDAARAAQDGSLQRWAARSALAGEDWATGFAGWQSEARARPEYAAARGKDLLPAFMAVYNRTAAEVAPHAEDLRKAFGAMQETMGTAKKGLDPEALLSGLGSDPGSLESAAQRAKGAPGDGRSVFDVEALLGKMSLEDFRRVGVPALRAMAEVHAGPDKEMFQQVLESLGRPGGNAASALVDANEWFRGVSIPGIKAGFPLPPEAEKVLSDGRAKRSLLRNLMDSSVDPVAPLASSAAGKMAENMLYDTASSIGFMATAAVPYVGALASIAGYQDQNEADLLLKNPGMSREDAVFIGAAAAPFQYALDRIEMSALKGKLPGVSSLLTKVAGPGGGAASWLAYGVANAAVEFGVEKIQDAVPIFAQKLVAALKSDVPDGSFEGFELLDARTLLAVLPLSLIGATAHSLREHGAAVDLVADPELLRVVGFMPAQIEKIQAEDTPKARIAMLRDLWHERGPVQSAALPPGRVEGPVAATLADPSAPMVERLAAARVEASQAAYGRAQSDQAALKAALDQNGITLQMSTAEEGKTEWVVGRADGARSVHSSYADAVGMARGHIAANDGKEMQAMSEVAGFFLDNPLPALDEKFKFTGAQTSALTKIAEGGAAGEQMAERVRIEEMRQGVAPGSLLSAPILGENKVEFAEIVGAASKRLVSSSSLHAGSSVLTVIEETIEGRWKALVASGRLPAGRGLEFVRLAEQATGQRFLTHSVEALAADPSLSVSDLDLTEAISHIVQADVMNRRFDGGKFAALGGAVSDGLAALGAGEVARGQFKTFLSAMRALFKAIFRTAAKLAVARASGKLSGGHDEFVNKLLGLDEQAEHNQMVEAAATAEAAALGGGPTYSLGGASAQVPAFMRDALDGARAMALAGKSSAEIRKATGWFPGKFDGKMRWEIPDEGASLRLSDYRAQRKAGDSPQDIARAFFGGRQDAAMQAAMGKAEGMGKVELLAFSKSFSEEKKAENIGLNTFYMNAENRERGRVPLGYLLDHDDLFAAYPDLKWLPVSFSAEDIGADVSVLGAYNKDFGGVVLNPVLAFEDEQGALSTLVHEIQHWIQDREGFARGASVHEFAQKMGMEDAAASYFRTAGEIEARDVQARLGYSAAQRAAVEPYSSENISKDAALVMFGGGSSLESESDEFPPAGPPAIGPFPVASSYSLGLSALHNLTDENLLFADRMGGLAVPSVAVLPAGHVMDGFGGITLVGGISIADPASNPVFDSDAYTARFPAAVYKKVKSGVAQPVLDALRPFGKKFGDGGYETAVWDFAESRPDPERLIQYLKGSVGVRAAFLSLVHGAELVPLMRAVPQRSGFVDTVAFRAFIASGASLNPEEDGGAGDRAIYAAAVAGVDEYLARGVRNKRLAASLRASMIEGMTGRDGFLNYGAHDRMRSDVSNLDKSEVDPSATRGVVDAALAGRESEFYSWVEKMARGLFSEPQLKVSGKMVPYTLDNIVRVMTAGKIVGAEKGMTFSEGAARAAAGRRFARLEQMREAAAAGGIVSEEAAKAQREELGKRLGGLREALMGFYKWQSSKWDALDDSMIAFGSLAKGAPTVARAAAAFSRKDFVGVPPELLAEAVDLAKLFMSAPVPYFESKPQRIVRLSEFKGAVVPDNSDPAAVEALRRAGVHVEMIPSDNGRGDPAARAAALAKITGEVPGASFSLASADYLESIAKRLAAVSVDPAAKLAAFARSAEALAGMARAVRHNDAHAVRRLSRAGIDRARAQFQAKRLTELHEEIDSRFPDLGEQEYLSSIANNPFLSEFFTYKPGRPPRARMQSRASAEAQSGDGVGGNYGGSDSVPWYFFGGRRRPDQMLSDDGIIDMMGEGASVSDMFERIGKELASVTKSKLTLSKYAQERAAARVQAREEAAAWAEEQAKAQAGIDFDRRELGRAMAALDTMLVSFPAEVRQMVGGFTKLADLKTNEARLHFFAERVLKLEAAMDNYLEREFTAELRKLVMQSRPKGDKGEKIKGKIGVTAHEWFSQVEPIIGMGEQAVADRLAAIEALLSQPDLKAGQSDELTQEWSLLHAFGAWRNKTAAEMATSFAAAQSVYDVGRTGWVAVMAARRDQREGMRGLAIHEVGGRGNRKAEDAGNASRKKSWFRSAASGWVRNLLSFRQVLADLFSPAGGIHERYDKASRLATRNERAARIAREDAFSAALNRIYGLGNRLGRQRLLWDLQQVKEKTGVLFRETSQTVQAIDFDVADRILSGEMAQKDHGLKKYEVTELRWLMDEHLERVAKGLPGARSQSLKLPKLKRGAVHEKALSRAQAMHLYMLYQMPEYRPGLARDGVDDATMRQVEDFLGPEDLDLVGWLGEQYEAGYDHLNAPFKRLYGVSLPRVKNYAPGTFQTSGNQAVALPGDSALGTGSMSSGFLRKRKPHAARVDLSNEGGAVALYWRHVAETEHWVAWAETIDEMKSVFFEQTVNGAVKAARGISAADTLRTWVDTLENDGVKNGWMNLESRKWLSAMMNARAKVALSWKVSVWLKQSTAALGASLDLTPRQFALSAARVTAGKGAMKYDDARLMPVMLQRLASGGSPEMRAAIAQGGGTYFRPGPFGSLVDSGMDAINSIDVRFTSFSAAVAFDAHYASALSAGMGEQAARAAAAERADATVAKTAQPVETMDKSLHELSMPLIAKPLFMFISEVRQKVALEIAAVAGAMRGTGSWAEAGKVIAINHLILGSVTWALGAMWRDLMNDDDATGDDPAWQLNDWLLAVVTGPLAGVPVLGDVVSTVATKLLGSHLPAHESSILQGDVANLGRAVAAAMQAPPEGEELEYYLKKSGLAARAMAEMAGGEFAAVGVAANVIEQVFNLGDDFVEAPSEATAKERLRLRAEAQDAREEADAARRALMAPEAREAEDVARKAEKAGRKAEELARLRAGGK